VRMAVVCAVLLLPQAALGAAPQGWSEAKTIAVVTTEYQFDPSRLKFRAGVRYRLHLVNRGTELHEFTAPEFFKSADLGNPGVLNADHTDIVLHPGEQKDLYLIPRQPGHFPLACADHDWAGMTGEITVK
jgi:uncharacterized cupredoxin-like copper-binding protein